MSRELRNPDNIKIHYAGSDTSIANIKRLARMGVNYKLYSAFPFVYKKVFGNGTTKNDLNIPKMLCECMRHVIQDSGLYSFLYGAKSDLATLENIYRWYDGLVEWTLEHGQYVAVVEIDCQEITGNDVAWDLRYRMKKDLPNHRIINVFHTCDGMKGLDRLIEFSDYIALSVDSGIASEPSRKAMFQISEYIKNKKPDIDIHLLGCTHPETLQKCRICTSCDSTTWLTPVRYGNFSCDKDYHVSLLDTDKVRDFFGYDAWNDMRRTTDTDDHFASAMCMSIEYAKRIGEKYAGNQDYTRTFHKDYLYL